MKKFILFFFAMVLGFATGMAREIVFDAAVSPGVNEYNDGDGSYVAADQSVTIGGVTIASPACVWYNVDPTKNQYRIYKGKDLTITSTVGPIVKVEFSCTASGTTKYGPGCFSEMEGYSYEGKIGVWTGEAEELVFHSESNQVRAEKIVVTLAEGGAVEPVLSAEDVNAKHSYYIYTDARGGLTIMDENATNLVGTAEAGVGQEVDATNPLQQFAFVNYEDALYLYSVGAGKFVNAAAKGILEDTPKTPILFKEAGENDVMLYFDDSHNINLGGSKQVVIDGWKQKDAGNSFHIMLAESFDPAPVIAALEEAKNGSAVVTYNYTIGGRVWKTVTSEQKKGETVAAPAEQAFVNIVSYNEDVVAEGLVVNVVCEEALPFTTSTEAKPVYGYLRGHSNQIRYIYVNEEGAGMDTGNLQEEMTEFADNYLWFISGNLLDGFQLHNKAYGVLRATEGQTSVNGEANSVWQLRAGSAGSKLTENIFALWAEGVTYMNCQGGLKYWDDNDAGSTFTFNVVETEEPAPATVDVVYTVKFNDEVVKTATVTETIGAAPSYDVAAPAYVQVAGMPETITAETKAVELTTTLDETVPFEVGKDYVVFFRNGACRYYWNDSNEGVGNEVRWNGNPSDISSREELESYTETAKWTMGGNWATGFTFTNAVTGKTLTAPAAISGGTACNLDEEPATGFDIVQQTNGHFRFYPHADAVNFLAHTSHGSHRVTFWNKADYGVTSAEEGGASCVQFEEIVPAAPTAVTFEFTDNEDGTITITPSDLKALYFFNIYSDRTNTEYQQGTDAEAIAGDVAQNLTAPESEVHTGVSVVDPAAWLQYWFGGYVQYTAGDYRLGVVELAYDGTYSMAGEPVFHAFTKAAEVEPVDPVTGSIATITAVFPNGNKHVVYSNGEKLTAGVEAPEGAVVKFDVVSRTENTLVLKAGDQYIHWTSGDNNEKSADLDGLNEDFDETLNTLTLAPATLQGCSTSATWGKTEEDVQGLYRLQGMGTNGRLFDFTLREFDDAWIAGDPGNIFFDTNWDGNGCRTSFFEITFEEESTEETFPMEGVAYKFKNVDSQLYVKVVEDAEQCVTLGQTPDEMFFTKVDGGWAISNSKGYQLGSTAKGWNIGNTATPIVWTIEEVEGGYAFKNEKGYLGYDTAAAGQKAFRDKNYSTHHGIFNIWKYDEEEIIVVPDKTLEETWANIHTLLADAEAIKELNEVTLTYDRDGYFEDFTSPIVGKVGYKKHDDVWAVCDGADYVNSFVSYFNTAAEADAYLADFGGLAALEEIITNVIDDYNAAEVVLPTPGKTYVIRNQSGNLYDEDRYSYAFYLNDGALSTTKFANATAAEHMWTCAGPVEYSYFDNDLNVITDTRYQFYNAKDNDEYFAWKRVDTDATKADTKWYLTGKNLDGSASPVYGTIAMHTYADNNQFRLLVIDMRDGAQQHANGHCWGNTFSDWYWFEEVEIPVTEWDGNEPVVEVQDATTVKVTFADAHSVEASNFGVLGAIFDEQGDVTAIVFNDLFGDTVEFGKDCATLHFKKISDINAELAEAAKGMASKVTAAANGDTKGKVVICSKSFKIDDNYLYNETIVRDFESAGNITGIDAIATDANTKVFDLQGRRVVLPAKGVFVKDGRKVVK